MIYRFVAKYRHWIFKKPEICKFRIDWTWQSWFFVCVMMILYLK
jgi:hypothetical protein